MKTIISVDPGPTHSAFVIWDGKEILQMGIWDNKKLMRHLDIDEIDHFFKGIQTFNVNDALIIEKIESMGMAVGASIFETVYWTGIFACTYGLDFTVRMPRRDVKMHLCGSMRAKDGNIIQALVDRFAYGEKNKGKGTKKSPGFFYGVKADIWQAFAVAVTFWDQHAI